MDTSGDSIASIVVSLLATYGLVMRLFRDPSALRVPRWHRWVDPERQPVLDTILSTDWVRWFLGFVLAWVIFAVFFVQLPQNPLDFPGSCPPPTSNR